jgi:hypothetical protein
MQLYRWRRDDPDNPYLGFLALADEVIVTADSISMLAEAHATGRPVHMFDTSAGFGSMRHDMLCAAGEGDAARALARADPDRADHAPGTRAYRALMRYGWSYLSRDISRLHLRLVRSGRMVWLGDAPPPSHGGQEPDDMARALDAIRALIPRG